MTEQTTTAERTSVEGLVRALEGEKLTWGCIVAFPEQCPNAAAYEVYGLTFCEVHGMEISHGAQEELFFDASQFLERFIGSHVLKPNPAAYRVLSEGVENLKRRLNVVERDADDSLKRAYPSLPIAEENPGYCADYDYLMDARVLLHKLMRLAFEARQRWIVETLEAKREEVGAQLAYLIRTGQDQQ